jgi:putative resolvase
MYSIGQFAKEVGVTVQTIRDWDKKNILKPSRVSSGGHRYYSEEQLNEVLQTKKPKDRVNVGYIRVSAKHQIDDLERQKELMELYLIQQGKPFQIISDIGSGINYNKKGLKELLKLISTNQIETLYLSFKDRLVRFGFELIEEFCKLHNVKIEIINQSENKTDEQEMIEELNQVMRILKNEKNDLS